MFAKNILLFVTVHLALSNITYSQHTTISDQKFELALIALDLDAGEPDGKVLTQTISSVTSLNVNGREITDLTGISDFTSLQYLYCNDNQLTLLDLTGNDNLKIVSCVGNSLNSLDFSSNTSLERLYCGENNLTTLILPTSITHIECEKNQLGVLNLSNSVSLLELNCAENQLSELLLANNDQLTYLDVSKNNLAALEISNAFSLRTLKCNDNAITHLDLKRHFLLKYLACSDNDLKILMLNNGNNKRLNHFEATGNPRLTCIEVDEPNWSAINWSSIDQQTGFSEKCNTYVPDDAFETYLQNIGIDEGPLDDYVLTENVENILKVSIQNSSVQDLTGIEDFQALEELDCSGSMLASLDLSQNNRLRKVFCEYNQLTSLTIGDKPELRYLYCYDNLLNNIVLGECPKLNYFYCFNNDLSEVDISQSTKLINLYCHRNKLKSLDLSQHSLLRRVYVNENELEVLNIQNGANTSINTFAADENPLLGCIEVDDPMYSEVNWTRKDAHVAYSRDCHYFETYVPDDAFEQALIDLGWDDVLDDYVLTANIKDQGVVDITGNDERKITDLTGIEAFEAMTLLVCPENELTTVDLSTNTKLRALICNNNQLASIDFGDNNQIEHLYCWNNNLTRLNLRNQRSLSSLLCQNNNLRLLNIQNGNNKAIKNFNTVGNPDLFCIQVEDPEWSTKNWKAVDSWTTFEYNYCRMTYVPDDGFEQYLIDLEYDDLLDDYVLTENIENIQELTVSLPFNSDLVINDLTGIEGFVALKKLKCVDIDITELDLNSNTSLEEIELYSTEVSELSIESLASLRYFESRYNELAKLDFHNNLNLESINVSENLDYFNIEGLHNLNYLKANYSELTSSEFVYGNNVSLEELFLIGNELTTLNTASFPALKWFNCAKNDLISLDVSNNTNLEFVGASFNSNLISLNTGNLSSLTRILAQGTRLDLDISKNVNLEEVNLSFGNVNSVKTGHNPNLKRLSVYENKLTDLDVSGCTGLIRLNVSYNLLEQLNLQNGNNEFLWISAKDNPNLTCIQVSNLTYAEANWSDKIDSQSYFSTDCGQSSLKASGATVKEYFSVNPTVTEGVITVISPAIGSYQWVNLEGEMLQEGRIIEGENQLDIVSFNSGMYVLRLFTKTESEEFKIVKE